MLKVINFLLDLLKQSVFFFFVFCTLVGAAQRNECGIPYFENISPSQIGNTGPWYDATQDDHNILYFSNPAGISSFDGTQWSLLKTQGSPILYKSDSGKIIVACTNYIGSINTDDANRLSLSACVTDSSCSFGAIQHIVTHHDTVFYTTGDQVYAIHNNTKTKISWALPVTNLIKDRDSLYFLTKNGLMEHTTKKLLSHKAIITSLIRTENYRIFLSKDNFWKETANGIIPFSTEIDDLLRNDEITCTAYLLDNSICIGTKSMGLLCINTEGKLLYTINEQCGLINNTINSILVDRFNNVWVTTDRGICRIELNSSITYFTNLQGLEGSVTSITRGYDNLYVGTDKGLFVLSHKKFLPLSHASCHCLVSDDNVILVGSDHGFFSLNPKTNTLSQISGETTTAIFTYNDTILSLTNTTLHLWKRNDDKTIAERVQKPIPALTVSSIARDDSGGKPIFVGTHDNGVWIIENDATGSPTIYSCNWPGITATTGNIQIYKTRQGLLFSTDKGLFRADSENHFFYPDTLVQIPKKITGQAMPIVEDVDGNLWMAIHKEGIYNNQIAVAWNTNNDGRYTLITAPFVKVRNFYTTVLRTEDDATVWLGGDKGLARMDFNNMTVRKTLGDIRFTKIQTDNDSIIVPLKTNERFPFNTSFISFDFAAVEFEDHDDLYYTYYLEGIEDQWCSPTTIGHAEYDDLHAGNYIFHVRAQRSNGAQSQETTFNFEIQQHYLLSAWAFAFYGILLIFIILWFIRLRSRGLLREKAVLTNIINDKTKNIETERNKAESILTNILPQATAQELIEKGKASSMHFDVVTILFSDFKNFTKIAESITPDSLIKELDKYFLEFDRIVERYNVEKIKTIGDAYMCAGGIPKKNTTNPIEVVAAALEMQYQINEMQKTNDDSREPWGIRIGIHTGPVIAGVVGSKKYSYDIWGDSVNIANRMESSGEVGKVNISESTYLLIRDFFDCEYRGKIAIKGKEEKIDMYFVNGLKSQFRDNNNPAIPNNLFTNKLALLRFEGLQEQVYALLDEKLPNIYFYHNTRHTIDVVTQVEVIGHAEGISDEDMFILKTAALFHDIGFIKTYKNHEHEGSRIVREVLPKNGYTHEQIEKICRLIECTDLEVEPITLLEKIIRDADLDYLGREDYVCISKELYKELLEMKYIKKNEYEWCLGQIQFLQNHTYYTDYAREQRNPIKVQHIQMLQEQIIKFNI